MQRAPDHVVLNTVVFDDLRLAYVPVPKAASTSILGALFELAGRGLEDRMRSQKHQATRNKTVHDGAVWDPAHRLKERTATEREWILESDEWFRFTVVREPARRIWSAWLSKVLVRDPRFVLMFGEDWFPAVPSNATDVVTSFRAFVTGLADQPDWDDPHWSAQGESSQASPRSSTTTSAGSSRSANQKTRFVDISAGAAAGFRHSAGTTARCFRSHQDSSTTRLRRRVCA